MKFWKAAPDATVDEAARAILKAFDRLNRTQLGAAELTSEFGDATAAQAALALLVESGCLRENLGRYQKTETGRLVVAGPSDLTLLGRAGCHLCEEALREIQPIAARFGARLRVVDIDKDRELRERYNVYVPVIFLGAKELARLRIDPGDLQTELSRVTRKK